MIRIIVCETDNNLLVVGALNSAQVTHRTFDVDLPEVEKWLTTKHNEHVHREFVGIEITEGG